MTVEGSDIYDHFNVHLTGVVTMVRIPIKDTYRPNFYIGVCFVRNKTFTNRHVRAKVSLDLQTLRVTLLPDKRIYKPGENATFTLKASDSYGRPARAELSVGVVDEAIYAVAEDLTPEMVGYFYYTRRNRVQTSFSFPEIYLSDPDKAGAGFTGVVRKRFVDTAYWAPNVVTDSNGTASVTVKMPDNLTTWRTTVRAITRDTVCGETRGKVVTQKDLLVRLEMPRFLIGSDHTTISAIVHNYTGRDQSARVDPPRPV